MISPRFILNGVPRFESEGESTSSVRSQRMWALIGLLAVHKDQWLLRSEAAATLWPDLPPERAKQNLRQTLLLCRETFGAVILSDRNSVQLNASNCDCDIWASGPARNFLSNLNDPWIEERRHQVGHGLWDVTEPAPDPALQLLSSQQGAEFDQTLSSFFHVWMALGHYNEPIRLLQKRHREGKLTFRGYAVMSLLQIYQGDLAEASSHIELLARSKGPGDDPYCLFAMASIHHVNLRLEASRDLLEKVWRMATLHDSFVLFASAAAYCGMAEHEEAMRVGRKFSGLAEKNGFEELGCLISLMLAREEVRQGQRSAALRRLRSIKKILCRPGRPGNTAQCLSRTGKLFEQLGSEEEAIACYETALDQAALTDGIQNRAEIITYLADYAMTKSDMQTALNFHREGVALRRGISQRWGLATSLRGAGVAALHLDLLQQAEADLREALACYEALKDSQGSASVLFPLAHLFARRDQKAKARRCALAAQDLIASFDSATLERDVPPIFVSHAAVEAFLRATESAPLKDA